MAETNIEWCTDVWNPVTGCTKVSEGCRNCYAEKMAKRLKAMGKKKYRNGFEVTCHPEVLDIPLKWKKPRRIFVNSMGDLFHPDVPDEFISKVWDVMWSAPQHTFLVLTKRSERMSEWISENAYRKSLSYGEIVYMDTLYEGNLCGYVATEFDEPCDCNNNYMCECPVGDDDDVEACEHGERPCYTFNCPVASKGADKKSLLEQGWDIENLEFAEDGYADDGDYSEIMTVYSRPRNAFAPNLHLGVSVEDNNQRHRIKDLLATPAAKRFVSIEPMLGPVDIVPSLGWFCLCHRRRTPGRCDVCGKEAIRYHPALDGIVCGGESGPKRRVVDIKHIRKVKDDCVVAGVPFFLKQMDVDGKLVKMPKLDGKIWAELPK